MGCHIIVMPETHRLPELDQQQEFMDATPGVMHMNRLLPAPGVGAPWVFDQKGSSELSIGGSLPGAGLGDFADGHPVILGEVRKTSRNLSSISSRANWRCLQYEWGTPLWRIWKSSQEHSVSSMSIMCESPGTLSDVHRHRKASPESHVIFIGSRRFPLTISRMCNTGCITRSKTQEQL